MMQKGTHPGMKRLLRSVTLSLMVGVSLAALGVAASASGGSGGGGGGGSATDTTTGGQVIRLSNFNQNYNGTTPKGQVTLGYAADGSAQSITYSLSQINVPDGTVLPIQVV